MDKSNLRTFIPANDWLYYKIYTGLKTADEVLTEIVKPVTEKLLSEQIIDKWFFIRYQDPKPHIRIRFHYSNPKTIFNIIQAINQLLIPYVEKDQIWKVQIDTYQREIERYGINTMDQSENLFFHDSNTIISMLNMIEGDDGEKIRWLFSLRAIDEFLITFSLNLQQKVDFIKLLADSFGNEFGINSFLIKQLSNKFRKDKELITEVLDRDKDQNSKLLPLFKLLSSNSENIKSTVTEILNIEKEKKLHLPLENLLSSYIHMMMNRIFKSKQRIHELVIYGFLYRHYKSMLARQKYNKVTTEFVEGDNKILT